MGRQGYDIIKNNLLNNIGLARAEDLVDPNDFNSAQQIGLQQELTASNLGSISNLQLQNSLAKAYPAGIN